MLFSIYYVPVVGKSAGVFAGIKKIASDIVFFVAMYSLLKKKKVLLKTVLDKAVKIYEISALDYVSFKYSVHIKYIFCIPKYNICL